MSIEPNMFDRPTVVAGYDADTVRVPVYVPPEAKRPTAPGKRDRTRAVLALCVFVALLLASGAAAYAGWG
ncbi:MAG TPA: hypothetical protein VFU21_01225 [Kofleriaceae bacterium]|nr:hypothetical protein [Kofleriaceae bacterium]